MIKLYGVDLSPFVRKVLFVLQHKEIEYEHEPTMPGTDTPEFSAISPLRKVPALVHDGFAIADSSVIMRYLDRIFPDNPVYPEDAAGEARALWLEEYADTVLIQACVVPFQERLLATAMFKREPDQAKLDEAEQTTLPELLTYVESVTQENGALVGDHLTVADISIASALLTARLGDYHVDERFPKLKNWFETTVQHPAVQERMQAEQALIKAFTGG